MTIESTIQRNDYIGNGLIASYDYVFKIFDPNHLHVIIADTNGVETVLVYPTNYSVSGVGRANGGTITLIAGALTVNYRLAIIRQLPFTQGTDLRNLGGYYPDTVENQLDKFVMMFQQLIDNVNHSIKVQQTLNVNNLDLNAPDPEPGKAIGWSPDGLSLVNLSTLEGDENGPFLPVDGHVPMTGLLSIFGTSAGVLIGDRIDSSSWNWFAENGTFHLQYNGTDIATWTPGVGLVLAGLMYGRAGGQGIGRVTVSTSGPPTDGQAGDVHFQF
jgi:hypothetical protein